NLLPILYFFLSLTDQQKFNLFREESEGYSKLITELCQNGDFDPKSMLNSIKSLIGCFNLDPNRVLDIILECFEARINLKLSFIPLITNFSNNSVTLNQILAFKFSFYNDTENGLDVPYGLYDVAASLLYHKLINIEDVYPFLSPTNSKICQNYQNDLAEAKNYPRYISSILAVEGTKHEDINVFEQEKIRKIGSNQKLGLILSLLKIGDWLNSSLLINKLPEFYAVSHPEITDALISLVHYLIGPLSIIYSGLPSVLSSRIKLSNNKNYNQKPIESVEEFQKIIMPMLFAFGPYLHRDSLLMTKIIRILRSNLQSNFETYKYEVLSLMNVTILPSFSLFESNSALSEELWSLLKLFPYNERFLLYNYWKIEPVNPLLIKMKHFTMRKIKYIMKRLSKDKDSIKQSGRLIGKLSHSNPTFLFEYILSQIQSYDNLIGPVVDSLKYLSSVSYDVLMFCVIEALSSPSKEHSKHEGTSISPWFISLANFCGSVIKKYQIELPGLLQFLANQLKLGKCLDLLILKEIVQKMTGIETSEEMTNEQLEAMSGGELLRNEGGSFNQIRNIKKSTLRLKDALVDNNLAMPLCILMAQQRNCIVFQSEGTHLKLIGKLYDQCQETLVQYGNFLSNSLTIDDYKRRLPSLKELLKDFHLNPDIAFFLTRPMIVHDIKSVFEELMASKSDKSKQANFECYNVACEKVLNPIIESIVSDLSTAFLIDLNFWTLTMYDLQVPEKSYLRERNKINQQIQLLDDDPEITMSKKRKEKERLMNLNTKLSSEALQQNDHVAKVMNRLEKEKHLWFGPNINKMDECAKYPGFVTKFCEKDPVHIDYESYRHVCHKWHYRLTKAFILCLDSGDYIQIRNSLIVLTKLLSHFPVMISFAQAIERRLDKIRNEEKEKRPDLFALATGYSGQLKSRKSTFIPESEFHEKENKKFPPNSSTNSNTNTNNTDNTNKNNTAPNLTDANKHQTLKTQENNSNNNNNEAEKDHTKSQESNDRAKVPKPIKARSSERDVAESKIKTKESSSASSLTTTRNEQEKRKEKLSPTQSLQQLNSSNSSGSSAKENINSKIESRASSASSSPKRSDYRSKDENDDYRKRKLDSKIQDDQEKRFKESSSSAVSVIQTTDNLPSSRSSSSSTYERKSMRKRQTKENNREMPEIKRKKEDVEAKTIVKKNEERELRKTF
ncbi:THO complex subunit 2-like protein, partial [Sarcoptes scabiei]